MTEGEAVVEDYVAMRLTLRSHPMALLRPLLTPEPGVTEKRVPPRGASSPRLAALAQAEPAV